MDDECEYEPYENDLEDFGNREAWEDAQADMRENDPQEICAFYEDGECPDCKETIPEETLDGESCKNCGHVFCLPKEDDDPPESERESDTPMGQAYGDGFEE